jgi:hypothetical protein
VIAAPTCAALAAAFTPAMEGLFAMLSDTWLAYNSSGNCAVA